VFPLLGLTTEILFWALAALLTFFVVIKWNMFSGRRIVSYVLRFSIIFLIQVLFISALGLTINRAGEFYSSWSDLVGIRADLNKSAVSTSALSGLTSHDLEKGRNYLAEVSSLKKSLLVKILELQIRSTLSFLQRLQPSSKVILIFLS
jgi:hypothetical protein